MSSVTEGKWQLRPEAWVDDGREVEVVSWGDLEIEHRNRLRWAEDDYSRAYFHVSRGNHTTARLCVQTGRVHKRIAMALYRLLVERATGQRGYKKHLSIHGRNRLRPYGTKALTERARL